MIDVVFISDLHLCPARPDIQERFNQFIQWAKISVKQVYILGDFFEAWVGDDAIDGWSREVATQIAALKACNIQVFYMTGNRDFLLGFNYAKLTGWKVLAEPALIELGNERVLLAHGDRYCTNDQSHQWFRCLTQNRCFKWLFLKLPLNYRKQLAERMRARSLGNNTKSHEQMDVVEETVTAHITALDCSTLIHGHTHKPGANTYSTDAISLKRYVLSDWDDNPHLLCYDMTKGFYFTHVLPGGA